MKNKRSLSVFMAFVIVVTSCCIGLFANAQDKHMDINKKMLDSILSDRYWIVETLADGNITNNPYAVVNPNVTSDTIMDEVLINYQNDKAFKTLVDAMEIYSNSGDYLSGLTDDVISVFENWFGDMDAVDDVVSSTAELKYESILNEVLKTDYTASWGDTLFEQNMDLENLKQKAEILNKLSSYQTALKDAFGLNFADSSSIVIYDPGTSDYSTYQIDIDDYVGHFLDAYSKDLETYLNSIIDIPSLEGNEALKEKIISVGALGMVSLYEQTAFPDSSYNIDDIFYDGMFDDTMKILNRAGKTLNIADKSMDYAILLEALQSQKNSTVNVMNRVSEMTSDEDLQKVLDNYSDLVNAQGDKQTLAYEVITDYLSDNKVITNIVQNKISQQAPKIIEAAALKFGGAKGLVLQNAIASALSTASAIVSLSVWVADQTSGIEDTAKKIYICKYLDKIIDEVIKTFKNDLNDYNSNKTDENAEKVLADLQFLKQLRLYGEKSAYGSMCSQMDSWIGILLGGGETLDYLKNRYQGSIDVLLGCSLSSQAYNQLSLSKGDVFTISTENVNGKNCCVANWNKGNGGFVSFAEADLRLLGGIDLNGATLNIIDAGKGFYLPLVENDTDGSVINIYCDNVAFGDIENEETLDINIYNEPHNFEVTDIIANSGTLNITNSGAQTNITAYDLTNSSNINLSGTVLYLKGTVNNSGTVSGDVHICADGSLGYDNSYFEVESQAMKGSGTYSDLYFENDDKKGVSILNGFNVTNYISNSDTRIKNSTNIMLTGSCLVANGYLDSGATLKDFSSSQAITFNDAVNISGNVALNGNCVFNDTLNLSSNCTEFSQNGIVVKGDLVINDGSVTGIGNVDLRGDLAVNTDSFVISNLVLNGMQSQSINSNSSISVNNFINHNRSVGGLTVNCKVYVSESLDNNTLPACKNGENIVLTGEASVVGNKINASVSAGDWNLDSDLTVDGTLYTSGTIDFSAGVKANVKDYYQSSGSLTVGEGAELNCSQSFYSAGTVSNSGTVNVKEDTVIKGAFSGGTLVCRGDITASAELTPDTLEFNGVVSQSFTNSSSTNVKTLIINNNSKSGFTVGSVINVSERFSNNCKNLINSKNIILVDDAEFENSQNSIGSLNVSGVYTVKNGEKLEVNGDLVLKSGSTFIVEDGGELIVKGHLSASSADISVESGGSITVNDYMNLSSVDFNVDGDLIVKSDSKLSSCTVDSSGTISSYGDLNSSSCTWNNANLSFVGRTPQTVSGSTVTVSDLVIDNDSKSGITFESKVNYNTLDSGSSVINGASNLVENA